MSGEAIIGIVFAAVGIIVGIAGTYASNRIADRNDRQAEDKDLTKDQNALALAVQRLTTLLERFERDIAELKTQQTARDNAHGKVTDGLHSVERDVDRLKQDQRRTEVDIAGLGKRVANIEATAASVADRGMERIEKVVTGLLTLGRGNGG
jgi:peptidoglycan hydrolase CwlO-like protein